MAKAPALSPYRRDFPAGTLLVPEISQLGYDRFVRARYGSLGAHSHQGAYEICYLVSGSVEWWNDDGLAEVRPGDIYFTRPDEVHGGADTVMHSCELYWVVLDMPAAFAPSFTAMRHRVFRGSPAVHACFEAIIQEHANPGTHAATLTRAKLDELLVQVVRDYEQHERSGPRDLTSSAIRKAMTWIQDHLAEEFSADAAAGVAGLRLSRFHERFLAETGFTPLEYHTRLRLLRARQLLTQTRRPITHIAFGLGFSSSQYFATVFKNHMGVTPREYREKHGDA